jgi:hypothetical protein
MGHLDFLWKMNAKKVLSNILQGGISALSEDFFLNKTRKYSVRHQKSDGEKICNIRI